MKHIGIENKEERVDCGHDRLLQKTTTTWASERPQ